MRFFKHCCVVFFIFIIITAVSHAQDDALPPAANDNQDAVAEKDNNDPQQYIQPVTRELRDRVYKKKLQHFDEQIEADNADIALIIEAAHLASNMAQYDQAIKYFRKAIRKMHETDEYPLDQIRDAHIALIHLYQREGKSDMAVATFKQICDNEPDNIELRLEFARFLQEKGFPRRAFMEYQYILSRQPDNLTVIDKIMQLHSQGHISKQEIESLIPQQDKQTDLNR